MWGPGRRGGGGRVVEERERLRKECLFNIFSLNLGLILSVRTC